MWELNSYLVEHSIVLRINDIANLKHAFIRCIDICGQRLHHPFHKVLSLRFLSPSYTMHLRIKGGRSLAATFVKKNEIIHDAPTCR